MASIINASTAGVGGVITTADNSGILNIQTAGTTAITVNASQNVGIGATSNSHALLVKRAASTSDSSTTSIVSGTSGYAQLLLGDTDSDARGYVVYQNSNDSLQIASAGAERMRIDSSGVFKVNRTTNSSQAADAIMQVLMSNSNSIAAFENTNATPYGIGIHYSGGAPNNTGSQFMNCSDTSATRFVFRSNGGLANFSANNVNLSDERTKKDIVDAGSYLDKICAIPVRTFLYKDQTDDELNLGVIAQEVEAVAPELVDVSGFGETPKDGVPLKAIYQTDLQYALMKSIQELKAIVDTQAEQIKALQGAK